MKFQLRPDASVAGLIDALAQRPLGDEVVGLGSSVVAAVGAEVSGLRELPSFGAAPVAVPSTPAAVWIWLRGDDRGQLVHRTLDWSETLNEWCVLDDVVDMFTYDGNRDLSGYEDGTENPEGDEARAAALVTGAGPGLDGSSFVAVQRWLHDLRHLRSMSEAERDDVVGRRRSDNEEFDSAPASAHVKRAAQESYEPEAFVVRRSMPWGDQRGEGLVFVAFGRSFDAFEAILRRMVGLEDGIVDGLFRFTRPLDGSYFWCPPQSEGRLELSVLRKR